MLALTIQDKHFECIQFFWHALLDFERDCSHLLKRLLRLLKSLMRRVETVTQHVNVDELERVDDSNATGSPSISRYSHY